MATVAATTTLVQIHTLHRLFMTGV